MPLGAGERPVLPPDAVTDRVNKTQEQLADVLGVVDWIVETRAYETMSLERSEQIRSQVSEQVGQIKLAMSTVENAHQKVTEWQGESGRGGT